MRVRICIYVIVCFTLDLNCQEGRRSFNVQSTYITEGQVTRNTKM